MKFLIVMFVISGVSYSQNAGDIYVYKGRCAGSDVFRIVKIEVVSDSLSAIACKYCGKQKEEDYIKNGQIDQSIEELSNSILFEGSKLRLIRIRRRRRNSN